MLGVLLTSLEIAADPPALDRCGSCTRCLDACPTAAFPAPYAMDPRRCISYLTIEQRGDIDAEFRAALGDWLFGCDICQAVCPFNRDAPLSREPRFAIRAPGPHSALDEIAAWDDAAHQQATAGSATRRASLAMWQRNAAVARENRA
ncbi:MAG: 4Fe-4S double cluster binding domain-containing protein [Phycisphaerae bacterium]